MRIFVIFGYPGAGKTYVGQIFKKYFGYYIYEGDDDMPKDMDYTIRHTLEVTDGMRDRFFQNMMKTIRKLVRKYPDLVVSQTFIREKHRKELMQLYPGAGFLLVQTKNSIREKRLRDRNGYPLGPEQVREMCMNFDKPHIPYTVIANDVDGESSLKRQIGKLLGE